MRNRFGYTRESLAEILDVSPQTVADWEEDRAFPDDASMRKLTQLYHLKPVAAAHGETSGYDEGSAGNWSQFLEQLAGVFPIIVVMLYLASGFLFKLWGVAWVLFMLIPAFYVCYGMYRSGRPVSLQISYPLMVVSIYLVLGFLLHLWHPAWLMFLTIPVVAAFSSKAQ